MLILTESKSKNLVLDAPIYYEGKEGTLYIHKLLVLFIIFQIFKSTSIKFEKMKSLLLCPDVMMTQLNARFMKRRRL